MVTNLFLFSQLLVIHHSLLLAHTLYERKQVLTYLKKYNYYKDYVADQQ